MSEVVLEDVSVEGTTLRGTVSCTGGVARFFSGDAFVADYGVPLGDVPDAVLAIPVLAHAGPVAWATGADLTVPTADATFLAAARRVRDVLCEMYPEFVDGGRIRCDDPRETGPDPGAYDGSGLLFTGGVDSMASYVRHREEAPALISVQGWVVDEDDRDAWNRNRAYFREFAEARGLTNHFVRSNMLSFVETPLLQAHFQRYLDGAWYSSVGHGLGLLGLCAPLAHAQDIGSLYMAASHTEEWSRPWGSDPAIDDEVRWQGTACHHDGYDLTRQEKIELIVDHARERDEPVHLRTCTHSGTPENCNDCEKCYRTIVGLLLAGQDPNDFGYHYDESTVAEITDGFESGRWTLTPTKEYHWGVLQDAARETDRIPAPGGDDLLAWLREDDLDRYVHEARKPLSVRLVQAVARNTPTPVYSTLYPMFQWLR